MNAKEAYDRIANNISDSLVKENFDLHYRINSLRRYVKLLESKIAILEVRDLVKTRESESGGGVKSVGVDE
jgi:hypothetical protein